MEIWDGLVREAALFWTPSKPVVLLNGTAVSHLKPSILGPIFALGNLISPSSSTSPSMLNLTIRDLPGKPFSFNNVDESLWFLKRATCGILAEVICVILHFRDIIPLRDPMLRRMHPDSIIAWLINIFFNLVFFSFRRYAWPRLAEQAKSTIS